MEARKRPAHLWWATGRERDAGRGEGHPRGDDLPGGDGQGLPRGAPRPRRIVPMVPEAEGEKVLAWTIDSLSHPARVGRGPAPVGGGRRQAEPGEVDCWRVVAPHFVAGFLAVDRCGDASCPDPPIHGGLVGSQGTWQVLHAAEKAMRNCGRSYERMGLVCVRRLPCGQARLPGNPGR
jgi:hypothetical protein